MPGPGNKKAKSQANKQKQRQIHEQSEVVIPTSLSDDVDDTPGSIGKINVLCKLLQIPGTYQRNIKCHSNLRFLFTEAAPIGRY